jgi:hypothetical protein
MSDRAAAPRESNGFEASNWLLAALPSEDLSSLRPHLEAVPLVGGRVLLEVDELLTRVYFIETGVVSLLTAFDRVAVGLAAVGREEAVGVAALLLGGDTAPARFQVLVSGSALDHASRGGPARAAPKPETAACEAHTRALVVQMLQAVSCNRLHTVEQQRARWLLRSALVVMEASGGYERLAHRRLLERGLAVGIVNGPAQTASRAAPAASLPTLRRRPASRS